MTNQLRPAMTERKVDVSRQQFEAWARSVGYSLAKHRTEDDWYVSNETQAASDGYQAALRSPAVAELIEAAPVIAGYDVTDIGHGQLLIQMVMTSEELDRYRAALAACTPAKEGEG